MLRREHSALPDADTTRTRAETRAAGDDADATVVIELRQRGDPPAPRATCTGGGVRATAPAGSSGRCLGRVAPATPRSLRRSPTSRSKTLREAGAAVGASHPTVLRRLKNAA
jgi:hypothetical protein